MMHSMPSTDASHSPFAEAASHPFDAHFIAGLGLLSLSGDNADNTATVSRDYQHAEAWLRREMRSPA